MKLSDLLDIKMLEERERHGYVSNRRHPSYPLAILNYTHNATFDNVWDEVTAITRGLIYNFETGEVIARPWPKFWNYNDERHPETLPANLPAGYPEITTKLDGSMLIIVPPQYSTNNRWVLATRGSFESEQAIWAQKYWNKWGQPTFEWNPDFTYLAEVHYSDNPTQVVESRDGITLLSMIETETGIELPYHHFASYVDLATFETTLSVVGKHDKKLSECLADPSKGTEREGYVLTWPKPDGPSLKVKIKLEDYKRLQKLYSGVSPRTIWETFKQTVSPERTVGEEDRARYDAIDKLVADTPESFRSWARNVWDKLAHDHDMLEVQAFNHYLGVVTHKDFLVLYESDGRTVSRLPHYSDIKANRELRKQVAERVKQVVPERFRGPVFAELLGNYDVVTTWIMKEIKPSGEPYKREE